MMTRITLLGLAVLIFAFGGPAAAQEPQNVSNGARPQPDAPRPDLLRALALAPDQVEAIKRINQERRPALQEARRRFVDAERALNAAIYSDSFEEAQIRARLGEFLQAQTELARLRFISELAIRKVLTPPQLTRFRELRRQFAQSRDAAAPGNRRKPGLRRIRPNVRPPQ